MRAPGRASPAPVLHEAERAAPHVRQLHGHGPLGVRLDHLGNLQAGSRRRPGRRPRYEEGRRSLAGADEKTPRSMLAFQPMHGHKRIQHRFSLNINLPNIDRKKLNVVPYLRQGGHTVSVQLPCRPSTKYSYKHVLRILAVT